MNKTSLLLGACLLAFSMPQASDAQNRISQSDQTTIGGWNADGTPTVVANVYGERMKAVRTNEGNIFLGWTDWGDSDYATFLQLVDTDGYGLLSENGKKVNTLGESGFDSNYGMALAADGNVVVVYPDNRHNPDNSYDIRPYAYKLDAKTGEHLWTDGGVAIPTDVENNVIGDIAVSGDNIYISFYDKYNDDHVFYMNRLTNDGTLAWESSKQLPGEYPSIVSSGDDVLVVYCENEQVKVQRYNADFEAQWDTPVTVSGDFGITDFPYSNGPFTCQSDEAGGVVIGYTTNSYDSNYYMQHVTADGTATMEQPVQVNADEQIPEGMTFCVNAEHNTAAFFWYAEDEEDWSDYFYMCEVGFDGNKGDIMKIEETGRSITVAGVKAVADEYVIAYSNSESWSSSVGKVARINPTERSVYAETVNDSGLSECVATFDNENVYFFWGASTLIDPEEYIYSSATSGVRIAFNDITTRVDDMISTGISTLNPYQENSRQDIFYDLLGRVVNETTAMKPASLYIKISKDGTTQKVIVK